MKTRRAPLLLTAASGLLAAAVAAAPMVIDRGSTLEAVPAAQTVAVSETPTASPGADPSAVADRSEQVTRDLERPALAQVANDRAAAQAQTLDAISSEEERLAAAEKKAQEEAAAKAAAEKQAQEAAAAKAAEEKAAEEKASGGYSGEPREIARQMMADEYGWGEQQFQCYDNIIMRESEWITTADNPTSSAYGIPQALPGSKMASAGADWRTNPVTQIRWGLGYVEERYGTPCEAWTVKQAKGWY